KGPGRITAIATAVCIVYIYGRALGPQGLAQQSGYRPLLSMHRVWEFQIRQMTDIFALYRIVDRGWVVAIWIAVTYLAWRRPRPVLRFCWIYMTLTPLPIEFILGRGQAALFVTLFGWAVFAAVICADVAGAMADFLSREPVLGLAGRRAWLVMLI